MFLYAFKNSFDDPCPFCKYDLLKNIRDLVYCIIYCTWMSFLYFTNIYYYNTLASLTLITLFAKKL
jgi:hypothetical protein